MLQLSLQHDYIILAYGYPKTRSDCFMRFFISVYTEGDNRKKQTDIKIGTPKVPNKKEFFLSFDSLLS